MLIFKRQNTFNFSIELCCQAESTIFQIIFMINIFRETGVHRIKFQVPEKTETIKLVQF